MINSGIDIQSLAYQLVQVDRSGPQQIFSAKEQDYNSLLKAYSAIKTKVNDFQDILNDLKYEKKFEAYTATTSEEGFATVTAGTNASPGEYQMNIQQLARADQYTLAFASETDPMPTSGILTLGVGTDTFDVDMSTLPAGATISELRDAINSNANNTGVQASIIRSGGSVQLMISSEETGQANTVSMSTDGSAEMADIQTAIDNKTQISSAQDAIVNLGDGGALTITSASNKMENVIDGLTVDLMKTHNDATGQLTITVGQDSEATSEKLKDFVDKFNAILTATGATNSDSAIASNSTARMIARQLKEEISGLGLGKMGIEITRGGTLSFNKSDLSEYLETNPDGLTEVFMGAGGLVETLTDRMKSYTRGESAMLNTAKDSVQSRLDRLQDQMDRFDRRMENRFNLYVDQFSRMQAMVQQLNSTQTLF